MPPPAIRTAHREDVFFEFSPVRSGVLAMDGPDPAVQVLAARGERLLVFEPGKQLAWVPQELVMFS